MYASVRHSFLLLLDLFNSSGAEQNNTKSLYKQTDKLYVKTKILWDFCLKFHWGVFLGTSRVINKHWLNKFRVGQTTEASTFCALSPLIQIW